MRGRFAGITAVVLALIACQAALAAGEAVTVRYWGNEADILAYEQIQDFERLHDGSDGGPVIKVIMGQSASVDRTSDPQRLLCAVAGGDPPDVVFFDRFAVGEWASREAFMCLQPLYEEDLAKRPDDPNTLRQEQFYPPCWGEACFEGRLYGVPCDIDNRGLFYNMDLLEKYAPQLIAAGCVDPNDPARVGPPRNWEQLKAAAGIMTERDANGNLTQVGLIPNFGNSWLYMYGWLNGGKFLSDDGKTCLLNEPAIVEALAFMTEIYDMMGGAEEVSAFQVSQAGSDLDPFMAGKVAMRIDGGGLVGVIANAKPDLRFGVVLPPAPKPENITGWTGGFSYIIPAGARHPREGWEFIKYMVSLRASRIKAEAQRQAAKAAGNIFIPALSGRQDVSTWLLDEYVYNDPTVSQKYRDATKILVDNLPFSKYRPVTPVGQLLWTEHVRAMERGIYKKEDPTNIYRNAQLALDRGTKTVQKELDHIYNPVPRHIIRWTPIVYAYIAMLVIGFGSLHFYFSRRSGVGCGYFRKEMYWGYVFAGPWFLGFIVFGGGPILFSFIMSFCEYDILSPPKFVGFENYVQLFAGVPMRESIFYKSLLNTVYMAIGIPLGMAVSLAIALLLSHEVKGMAVYRTLFYLPAIMPTVAASILWIWIFNPQQGILNTLLRPILQLVGMPPPAWLQDPFWAKPALIIMGLWGAGAGMLIWLAGIKGVPRHLYEAAELDGAGPWGRFRHVTLPMLSPYVLFNLIMGMIGTFQIFTQAYIMTQGGPVDATLFYAYALFNNAFRYMRMGYASSMAWVLFAIVLVLTIIQIRLSRIWVHYESDS